jgi:septum formation protein
MRIVLASASPRRRELLSQLGLEFEVCVSSAGEAEGADPIETARQAALAKASEVASKVPDALVIGADTIVVIDGEILGKPTNPSEAEAMLKKLKGKAHRVITGVAIVDGSGKKVVDHEDTTVFFADLSEDEVRSYMESGEGADKAGAYAIQGLGALFIPRIEGSYSNVVGLPLAKLHEMLKEFGIDLLTRG